MQPPPPAGRTGRAPPGADGDGGAFDPADEVADVVDVLATVIDTVPPTAKTSAATQMHHAPAVLACRLPTASTVATRCGMCRGRAGFPFISKALRSKSLADRPNSGSPQFNPSRSGVRRRGWRGGSRRRGRRAEISRRKGMRWIAVSCATAVEADKTRRIGLRRRGIGHRRHCRDPTGSQDQRGHAGAPCCRRPGSMLLHN